jgi:hypothetical protein
MRSVLPFTPQPVRGLADASHGRACESSGGDSPRADGGTGGSGGGSTRDSGASSDATGTWSGTLASTGYVPYGDEQTCKYRIRLTDVKATADLSANGSTKRATFEAVAVEELLGACPAPAAPPDQLRYTFDGSSTDAGVMRFTSDAKNRTGTQLEGTVTADGDGGRAMVLTLKRTDLGPPLAWSIPVNVPLSMQ